MPLEFVAATCWDISAKGLFQSWGCYRTERVRPELALAEPNTKHRELQWRNSDYFIREWRAIQEKKLRLKSPMACKLEVL